MSSAFPLYFLLKYSVTKSPQNSLKISPEDVAPKPYLRISHQACWLSFERLLRNTYWNELKRV